MNWARERWEPAYGSNHPLTIYYYRDDPDPGARDVAGQKKMATCGNYSCWVEACIF